MCGATLSDKIRRPGQSDYFFISVVGLEPAFLHRPNAISGIVNMPGQSCPDIEKMRFITVNGKEKKLDRICKRASDETIRTRPTISQMHAADVTVLVVASRRWFNSVGLRLGHNSVVTSSMTPLGKAFHTRPQPTSLPVGRLMAGAFRALVQVRLYMAGYCWVELQLGRQQIGSIFGPALV